MNAAILLPGQGAQHPGMGKAWAERFPAARAVFEQADDALGFALSKTCFEGGDAVHRTDVAQPGILTTSAAILTVLVAEEGLDLGAIPFTAGLSLGEYTALWVAGSLSFADAVRLVRLRGEAMQDASDRTPSSMTSLVGATREQAEALAAVGARHGICSVANLNAPGQVVLAGELVALEAVENEAKAHGVRRAVRLSVAGGFHSECMRPAADRLAAALAEVDIRRPRVPFASNVDGRITDDPAIIRRNLAQQVCAPVQWEASMRNVLARGIRRFLEPGPGNVLGGLMRKIDGEAEVRSVAEPGDVRTG
jgi:[acyl-carrier-protein] S-malonyltransferase